MQDDQWRKKRVLQHATEALADARPAFPSGEAP